MKYIVVLIDGLSDRPIEELGSKTPLEYANTPNMDKIARDGRCGMLKTLFDDMPTSSDVANMSVLGYDPHKYYTGRGAVEAIARGIELDADDIAFRCNLVTINGDVLIDYSSGHISQEESETLINDINNRYGSDKIRFYSGNTYRNILVLKGSEFSDSISYHKPDDIQGQTFKDKLLRGSDEKGSYTANMLNNIMLDSISFLENHEINIKRKGSDKNPANMIWLWSPGKRPNMPSFYDMYKKKAAIISAVDVIFGIGRLADMECIYVEGATGYIDTNYEGKANAAIGAIDDGYDFVYLHIEAVDECSHIGDIDLKIKAIEDIDRRVIAPLLERYNGGELTLAILPDHSVPIKIRKHTRDKVPFAILKPGVEPDSVEHYSERECKDGYYDTVEELGFLKRLFEDE